MESIEEAIAHYTGRKSQSEISLSEIRKELTEDGKFSTAEISKICRTISDDELSGLKKKKTNPALILNHPAISYVLAGLFSYLVYFSLMQVLEMDQAADSKYKIWRYALLAGSVFFFLRNLTRVIKNLKG
ncbi:MAG: hypothetical protein BM555_05340 [Crocinitomix sp. MedPE-SWsnd]|nr:MAG: hypothetical protein BM555_05340 [Crocinitomix sp. MedPE-SWsnd]